MQSAFGADGVQAQHFNSLFTLFMVVTGIAYLFVILFLGAALLRRRRERTEEPQQAQEKRVAPLFAGWIAFILVGLTVLTFASYFTDRADASEAGDQPPLEIEVTANQWWWEVEYRHPTASNIFRTANELHLPLGVPAHITLRSNDVIHSFWVPNLAGKQDLIPGRQTDVALTPAKPGQYRGQCAEYCGMQHAHMALDVTVESRAEFERWWAQQLTPAAPPADPLRTQGLAVFLNRQCSSCHAIAGTDASGTVGPDLTHLASRKSLAAGTLPMTRGHLYGWVADPQSHKPGNRMPRIPLNAEDLHAVIAYLEGLT